MPSPLVLPTLAAALRALGNAHAYYAASPTPATSGGWAPIGQKAGPINVKFNEALSVLTAPELTGPAPHATTVTGAAPVVTLPLIMGDETIMPILSPSGSASGGSSYPVPAVYYGLAIIPDAEMGGGLSYPDGTTPWTRVAGNNIAGGTGAGVAPKNAIWLWRGTFSRPESLPYTSDNGGSVVTNILFTAHFDTARAEGHKLWTYGDPVANGFTAFRL